MTELWTDKEGPGSFEDIVLYVEKVLMDNFVPNDERRTWPEPYLRSARAITHSVLHRLGVRYEETGDVALYTRKEEERR